MVIDFSPVDRGELTIYDFALTLTSADLRAATNASLDTIRAIIGDADDFQLTHTPYDPEAHDPYAPPELQHVGWSLAHLVVHVTASSEEDAAVASILARGIPYAREPRLRHEIDWQTVTTRAQVLARIEESRRIRLAYLDAFPDQPRLDVFQAVSERFLVKYGKMNAPARFLMGLRHEIGHHTQFREAARQAREVMTAPGD